MFLTTVGNLLSYSRSQICSNDKKCTFYGDIRLRDKYNRQINVIFIKELLICK